MALSFALLNAWVTTLALAVSMLIAGTLGFRQGRRLRDRGVGSAEGKFGDASLALLGLLLAFTFAMALGKYDTRRMMLIDDTNAIGDFYTCTTLLPDPARAELKRVIREYVALRLEISRHPSAASLRNALPRFQEMHGRMNGLVEGAVRDGTPIAIPLVNTLNDVTSRHTARLAVVKDRLPPSIIGLLFLAAVIATALVARQQGAAPHPDLSGMAGYVLLVTFTVFVVMDLNQFTGGMIRVSQEPMERLFASLGR